MPVKIPVKKKYYKAVFYVKLKLCFKQKFSRFVCLVKDPKKYIDNWKYYKSQTDKSKNKRCITPLKALHHTHYFHITSSAII